MIGRLLGLGVLIFVGFAGWQIGGRLSSDAIGMALGLLFGVMAGIPAALMVLAAGRQSDSYYAEENRQLRRQLASQRSQPQAPVIVVVGANGQPVPHRQNGDVIEVEATPTNEEIGSWRETSNLQLVDSQ